MVTVVAAIIVGTLTGILSGMGIGGGTLLVLYLTAVHDMPPSEAAGINLLYFLSCAPASLWFHIRQGRVDRRVAVWAMLGGVITALIASVLAPVPTPPLLRRAFGALLLIVGARELWQVYRARHDGAQNNG